MVRKENNGQEGEPGYVENNYSMDSVQLAEGEGSLYLSLQLPLLVMC